MIRGKDKDFPITIKMVDGLYRVDVTLDTREDLVNLFYEYREEPLNQNKPLDKLLNELGIEDTVMFFDRRTFQILENYLFYRQAPHLAFDSKIWFRSVLILNGILWQK